MDQAQKGSVWKSYRVYTKNGTVVKEEPLHNSTYKAKPARIKRNTTVMTETTAAAEGTEAEGAQAAEGAQTAEGAETTASTEATAGAEAAEPLPSSSAQTDDSPVVPQNPGN